MTSSFRCHRSVLCPVNLTGKKPHPSTKLASISYRFIINTEENVGIEGGRCFRTTRNTDRWRRFYRRPAATTDVGVEKVRLAVSWRSLVNHRRENAERWSRVSPASRNTGRAGRIPVRNFQVDQERRRRITQLLVEISGTFRFWLKLIKLSLQGVTPLWLKTWKHVRNFNDTTLPLGQSCSWRLGCY